MTIVSIIIALAGTFLFWKAKDFQKEVNEIQKLKKEAEKLLNDTKNDLSNIIEETKDNSNKIVKETKDFLADIGSLIQKAANEATNSVNEIEGQNKQVKELVASLEKQSREKISPEIKKEILESVEEINQTKPETELTAEDWFLKGNSTSLEAERLINKSEKESKLREASLYYQKSVVLNPNSAIVFSWWGWTLNELAKLKQDESLLNEAIDKHRKAIDIDPANAAAYNNWGRTLNELAKLKQDESLLNEAIDKYKKAIDIDPANATAYNNWGWMLNELAILKQDESLFNEAIEKLEKATQLEKDFANPFNHWGRALLELGKITDNRKLYKESIEKCMKAVELKLYYPKAYYNLTCSYSLLGDKDKAFEWLEKYLENSENKFNKNDIENDYNLNSIRDNPRFKELLDKYL